MTIQEIRTVFEYDAWATRQLLEVVGHLTPEQFTREFAGPTTSIRQQFVHLVSVIDRYRARLASEPVPDVQPEEFATPRDLVEYEAQVRERLKDFLSRLTEAELSLITEQVTRRGTFHVSCGDVLRQVVNHGTYHRGQIAMLLKLSGVDFPDTDLILWPGSGAKI
ncbi:MAG: DinB family protein [Armatimonadota bacterium]|nr:DinB family protein [Armatimonadota bacterium]